MTEPADTEGTPITLAARVARLEETVAVILGLISALRQDLGRASAPIARTSEGSDITAQEQRTGMRGYTPFTGAK